MARDRAKRSGLGLSLGLVARGRDRAKIRTGSSG